MTDWWKALYDDALADVLLEDTSDVTATVAFLVDALGLARGSRVFDQCSGTGRLAIPLARWGARVVGVEQAARYVERANAAASTGDLALPPQFVVGDAFEYVPPEPCDAAINWWTSFGYLPDDDGNARMLRRAFESLRPGGRFAIDYPNFPGLFHDFRQHDITRRSTANGEIVMLRETRFELARGLVHKTWTFVTPDGRRFERPSTVRMYMPDRLAALVASVGFEDVTVYGGIDRQPITLASPRCIVVARRPA